MRMPKKKPPLPDNIIDAVERWALKNCNTNEEASEIVDARIRRVCREIQDTWTEAEEAVRKVTPTEEYFARSYRVNHRGTRHDKQFLPEKDRK